MMMLIVSCKRTVTTNNVCPPPIFPSDVVMDQMRLSHPMDTETAVWYFEIIDQQDDLANIK